jgi:hypothetical protein
VTTIPWRHRRSLELPAPESSPYAEVQPDRRNTMQRLALLYRLAHHLAPPS